MSSHRPPTGLGQDEFTSQTKAIFSPLPGVSRKPDTAITKIENDLIRNRQQQPLSQMSLEEFTAPARPAYVLHPAKIDVWTNYFTLTLTEGQRMFRYKVQILPRITISRKRQRLFEQLLDAETFRSLGKYAATDYMSTIITPTALALGVGGASIFEIEYQEAIGRTSRANSIMYRITITYTEEVPLKYLQQYINTSSPNSTDSSIKDSVIQALNIVVANFPNREADIYQHGPSRFFRYPSDIRQFSDLDLQGGLIGVRGYFSSVRPSTGRILLNVNAQCSAFYKAINLADLMKQFEHHFKRGRASNEDTWKAMDSFIKGLRVSIEPLMSLLPPDNGGMVVPMRIITIRSLAYMREPFINVDGKQKVDNSGKLQWKGPPAAYPSNAHNLWFPYTEMNSPELISVFDYYDRKYGRRLQDPDGFNVVNCGTDDNASYIPAELCTVLPGQAYRGELDEIQVANILKIAAVPPGDNVRRIVSEHGGLGILGILPVTHNPLDAFGIKVTPEMIVAEGGKHLYPKPTYANSATPKMYPGSWSSVGQRFVEPKTFPKWTVLKLGKVAFGFAQYTPFKKAFLEGGMTFEPPEGSPNVHHVQDPEDVGQLRAKFEELASINIRLLLVILPSAEPSVYANLKFLGDVKYGIHTISVQNKKLHDQKTSSEYYANIALKFNLKGRGTNHVLPDRELGFLSEGTTMLMGMDVTHPAPHGMPLSPSIASVVASIDAKFSQWPASIRCQKGKQEIIDNLDTMTKERLEVWIAANNGRKPEKILIYRDGVSEGQYTQVQKDELVQIRSACDTIYGNEPKPKITLIIVGKRHHTRFYPTTVKNGDSRHGNNPQAGTAVDRGITMHTVWDFYLQPHVPVQGTAKPAHYVALLDEIGLGAEQLQKISHNLCYLCGRANKAISIVPPVFYADVACTRGRAYLANYLAKSWPKGTKFEGKVKAEAPWSEGVHERLKKSMFYI